MKKGILTMLCAISVIGIISPITVMAGSIYGNENDLVSDGQGSFENIINEIIFIKNENPELSEDAIKQMMDECADNEANTRGVSDTWNALTDSEKKLCIRYPFAALKVNEAKNIATSQTEKKFGRNGLGDRSDAFRHGIWNAEMTILIGEEKAELFATAHEDKDTSGIESDGFPKVEHKNMDIHNNLVGRQIGKANIDATEDELANIIYSYLYADNSDFIWLHE